VVDDAEGYGFREHFSIPRKLRRLKADLLHSPHYVLPLFCTTPAVVTVHDCIHLLFPQYLPSRYAWRYAHFMMGSAIKRSALVFTVSEATRRDILHFFPLTDPEKIQVVPNTLDPEVLEDPGEEEMERVRERYQIRGRFVLYAGNIKPHKNLDRLITAFSLLRRRGGFDDVRLVIVGSAEENKYAGLRRTAEVTGVRNDVRFFGFVPDRTLSALYRLSSVFAFPSLYEGFGLPPLEAMACGTPVVTSRLSSLPEVVGEAAVFVDPWSIEDIADGLARALTDEALRAELSKKGLERAKAFSWERSVKAIHAGYMKALGRSVAAVAAEPAR
jgi:glycosyltransferase involved in cell wall biosynthesis